MPEPINVKFSKQSMIIVSLIVFPVAFMIFPYSGDDKGGQSTIV